jgi:DNA-binding MarR family transcriptional regulator
MQQDKDAIIRHITSLGEEIFRYIGPNIPQEWLVSDVTVAQLRVLLVLYAEGPSRMSVLATRIGVALPTITGIVDNLVKKEMVVRGTDPEDRRLVICTLSPRGQETVSNLWTMGRFHFESLLEGLTVDELKKADEVAVLLLDNTIRNLDSVKGVKG